MGDENRNSAGSSTAMIVIAILGGLLLVGCCGGVVVVGSVFMVGNRARDAQLDAIKADQQVRQAFEQAVQDEAKKAQEEIEGQDPKPLPDNGGTGIPDPARSENPLAPGVPREAEKK